MSSPQPTSLSPFSAVDHTHMARALRLAERGLSTTQPNPRVGCVLAHGDEIVGEGWHERAGGPHAEVFALRVAEKRARGATAYVTLEPCAHFGRTPQCADALIAAGIARVVVACEDSFHKVDGRGLEKMRTAGIAVDTGLMRDAARELNRGFFSRIERLRPWLRMKIAMSLDGRTALANGASKWITGEAARDDVQRWRARSSAILTGSGTVLADNPRLTVRPERSGRSEFPDTLPRQTQSTQEFESGPFAPLRIALDSSLRIPCNMHLLDGTAPTLVFHAEAMTPADDRYARTELVQVAADAQGRLDLAMVMRVLAERGVNELQVEAGPTLCGALISAGLVDELLLYVAPLLLGDQARPLLHLAVLDMNAALRLRVVDQHPIGGDLRLLVRR